MSVCAVILAAGRGSRMKMDQPKQFLEVAGKPLLYYSIKAFQTCADRIVVVTGTEQLEQCKAILHQFQMEAVMVTEGGEERWISAWKGLQLAGDCEYVMIHDAARACVTAEVIRRTLEDAKIYGAAAAAVPSKDTIRIADSHQNGIQTPPRDSVWMMQTPQTFSRILLEQAYHSWLSQSAEKRTATDDAMIVEAFGKQVHLSMGDYSNIKVTTPEDLPVAEQLLRFCV